MLHPFVLGLGICLDGRKVIENVDPITVHNVTRLRMHAGRHIARIGGSAEVRPPALPSPTLARRALAQTIPSGCCLR